LTALPSQPKEPAALARWPPNVSRRRVLNTNNTRLEALSLSAMALAVIPFVFWFCAKYVSVEHPAYSFDYGGYWEIFKRVGTLISNGSAGWASDFLTQIRNSDYNPAPVLPLYPSYLILGDERSSYLVAISLVYLLPTVVIAAALMLRSTGLHGPWAASAAFLTAFTYLPFWAPTLRGMVDISGLVFLGLATLVLFKSEFLQRRPILTALALGVLLWLPFLFRRWYAFCIIAFFVTSFGFGLFVRWRGNNANWQSALRFTLSMGLAGLIAVALVATFQSGLAKRAVSTSYADLYEAYQLSFLQHIRMISNRLGWYIIAMMAVGTGIAISTRNLCATFCLFVAALTWFLFIHVQRLGPHHFLPVAFWLLPVYFVGIVAAARYLVPLPKSVRLVPAALISMAIFAFGVSPRLQANGALGAIFIPRSTSHPLHLKGYAEYRRLIADLETLLKNDRRLVVFASSGSLSDSLLEALAPSLRGRINRAPHIANRDFFPFELLRSEYALATDPPQTDMKPGAQDNLLIPNEMLIDRYGFGTAFKRMHRYQLGDITAYLFHRERFVTATEMKQLLDHFVASYPNWRDKYKASMSIPLAVREVKVGDSSGRAQFLNATTLFLHPGRYEPTIARIPINAELSERPSVLQLSMKRELIESCPHADGVRVTINFGPSELWYGSLHPGESARIMLPNADGQLSILVDKNMQPSCDHVQAAFEF
jgi:hypothetical protein